MEVQMNDIDRASRDLLRNWRFPLLVYGAPTAAIMASGSMPAIGAGWRTAIWATASLIMGGACLANATRCGRVHCFFTGPFFTALAAAITLYGTGLLPLGPGGWNVLGLALLVGGVGLTVAPELVAGKYWGRQIRPS
jgi:hypothetical protein